MRRALLYLCVIGACLSAVPPAATAGTTQPGCQASDPFTPAFAAQLASQFPGQRFTASVYDQRTGCQYDFAPEQRITTASVVKVEFMAGLLLRAQAEGRALSAGERALIEPMIEYSDNDSATAIWKSLGGDAGMNALNQTFGMFDTVPAGGLWGNTLTSARDQVALVRQLLLGDYGPVGASYRAEAEYYMTHVVPEQRWGITAGVPAGWVVAEKNGFAPNDCCAWRINSTGLVRDPSGGAYAITILSEGWPDEFSGHVGVETVSRAVAAKLTHSFTAPRFYLRNKLSSGGANKAFVYGDVGDRPIVGDWNGDGQTTAGVTRQGLFLLRNGTGGGTADVPPFRYGDPGDEVLIGDWDGNGTETVGVRRGNTFFLRLRNRPGSADLVFTYGEPADRVVVGDWNGDGVDTIGVVRNARFFLRNTNSGGVADVTVRYGDGFDLPVAGDWNGDGVDTIGVVRNGTWYLRNTNSRGAADVAFAYGDADDPVVIGDWDNNSTDTVGVARFRS